MKKTMFILFILAYLQAIVQGDSKNKEMRTLHDRKSQGFYFAGTAGFSQIDMKDDLTIGGRAAFIFSHSTAVGLAGYGF